MPIKNYVALFSAIGVLINLLIFFLHSKEKQKQQQQCTYKEQKERTKQYAKKPVTTYKILIICNIILNTKLNFISF